ncbi:hypothetical protein [Lewinella sp. IMCC34183]|uniref:hypothetical protein n=1 Tax=Lewinella sp. IMCC34183 TaxID=2248762 RepID=UPI000E22FD80|nr:hypothetical protein [Lewinella sp. IMCC34183]
MIRLFCVAAGVVFMITGCNGLLSLRFGTHRLRNFTLVEAEGGVGDADYLQLTGARADPAARHTDTRAAYPPINLWPVLTPTDIGDFRKGVLTTGHVVAWWQGDGPDALPEVIRGTVERPGIAVPPTFGDGRLVLEPPVTYLHLNNEPTPWYWQLTLFVGGLVLAIGTEALTYRRRAGTRNYNP